MSVTINARGTSVPFFRIGKSGVTLYQGSTNPTLSYTVELNDYWFDTSSGSIKIYKGTELGWQTVPSSTATKWATQRQLSFTGDVTGSSQVDGSADVSFTMTLANTSVTPGSYTNSNITVDSKGRITSIANGSSTSGVSSVAGSGGVSVSASTGDVTISTNATPNNTASTIVSRDSSGNFSAATITASLTGNASTATTLATARTINGTSFDGSTNITITAANPSALTIGTGLSGTSYDGSSAVTIAIDSSVVTTTGTQTLTNKTLTGPTISDLYLSDSSIVFEGSSADAFETTLTVVNPTADRTITIPDATGTLVTTGDTGTITSTMIADGTIVDADINAGAAISVSKLAASTISGVTLGNNLSSLTIGTGLSGTSYNGSGAVTIAIDSSVVTTTGTQTLTSKTLTSPAVSGLYISDSSIVFEGSVDDEFETTLTVTNPTADRTITIPNITGTLVTTGDTGTVTSTMLTNTGISAGSYTNTNLTVDAAGRITAISNGSGGGSSLPDQTGNSGKMLVTDGTNASWSQQIASLGVGTASSGTTGEIRATNQITAYYSSDRRLKENIKNIECPLDKLKCINGVTYDWTDEYIKEHGGEDGYFVRKHDVGVIAQEIESVLPEIVAENNLGYKAVKYERLVALLIESVKDLSEKIDFLEAKIEKIQNK